jgi:hypothetical protein
MTMPPFSLSPEPTGIPNTHFPGAARERVDGVSEIRGALLDADLPDDAVSLVYRFTFRIAQRLKHQFLTIFPDKCRGQ